ncbi:PAS domain S-box protein [Paenalkalicoccus suaedae]|uniref:histidine kinase n=1 Tax=Paenalkalicoccus suaedae TaxID=2592382 RepID=A0A859FBC2_9BACI|nr:PAS domain-containing sensor histidine kinase [Paenalkalicoccus suaedae]QKS70653.1 PAS domain S-box protein [Paenalkalicoccus suaedae]
MKLGRDIKRDFYDSLLQHTETPRVPSLPILEALDFVTDAVLIVSEKWNITYANQAAVHLLGENVNLLTEQSLWDIHPHIKESSLIAAISEALARQKVVEVEEYDTCFKSWLSIQVRPRSYEVIITVRAIGERFVSSDVIRESYRTLFSKHPDAVCSINLDGHLLAVNDAFNKLFKVTEEEILGEQFIQYMSKDHYRSLGVLFDEAKNGNPQSATFILPDLVGNALHLSISFIPIIIDEMIIGVYGIVKDQTDERHSLNMYDELSSLNELIVNSIDEGIAGFNDRNEVIIWNAAAEDITGYKRVELSKNTFDQLLMQADALHKMLNRTDNKTSSTVINSNNVTIVRKDGTLAIVDCTISPLRTNGKIYGHVCTFRDVTEKKKTEEIIHQSDKLSAVGQLAAGIAHEIRNPLTALKGFLQLMEMSGVRKQEYFDIMNSEFNRIEQILTELLVLSKPPSMHYSDSVVQDIINDIVTLLNTQAIIKNIYITTDMPEHKVYIRCIKNQIKQVFVNFIKNSIEAMESGTIQIKVVAEENTDDVTVFFEDNGTGIPKELLKKVGEPFFTTKEKGTGLGLMVSSQIIRDHRGELRITSEENVGTICAVTLPTSS